MMLNTTLNANGCGRPKQQQPTQMQIRSVKRRTKTHKDTDNFLNTVGGLANT
jgi:hypothetical protein